MGQLMAGSCQQLKTLVSNVLAATQGKPSQLCVERRHCHQTLVSDTQHPVKLQHRKAIHLLQKLYERSFRKAACGSRHQSSYE